MGVFIDDEESTYRKLTKAMAVGGVLLLFGLLLLIFGRAYGFDGSNHDLFLVFGLVFLIIGMLGTGFPLIIQMKILFRGIKRKPSEYIASQPAPSAAGQAFRNTQIFSSVAPSSYDGQRGAHIQPQQPPHQFSSAAAFAKGSNDQLAAQQPQSSMSRPPPPPSYQQTMQQGQPSESGSSVHAPVPMARSRHDQQQLLGHSSDI